jgi:hypothetical protein
VNVVRAGTSIGPKEPVSVQVFIADDERQQCGLEMSIRNPA